MPNCSAYCRTCVVAPQKDLHNTRSASTDREMISCHEMRAVLFPGGLGAPAYGDSRVRGELTRFPPYTALGGQRLLNRIWATVDLSDSLLQRVTSRAVLDVMCNMGCTHDRIYHFVKELFRNTCVTLDVQITDGALKEMWDIIGEHVVELNVWVDATGLSVQAAPSCLARRGDRPLPIVYRALELMQLNVAAWGATTLGFLPRDSMSLADCILKLRVADQLMWARASHRDSGEHDFPIARQPGSHKAVSISGAGVRRRTTRCRVSRGFFKPAPLTCSPPTRAAES